MYQDSFIKALDSFRFKIHDSQTMLFLPNYSPFPTQTPWFPAAFCQYQV